jgi:hypothetical protein
MSSRPRGTTWLAWALFACFLQMVVATFVLNVTRDGGDEAFFIVLVLGFAVVGALVATRQPTNSVGWLLLAIALTFGLQSIAAAWINAGVTTGLVTAAWFDSWIWYVWITLAGMVLPLVFPSGRLLGPAWRWVLALVVVATVLSIVGVALEPGPLDSNTQRPVPNPVAPDGGWGDVIQVVGFAGEALAAVGFLLAMLALVLRLRRSRGVERQQIKTFCYVVSLAILGLVVATGAEVAGEDSDRWVYVVGAAGWFTALLLIIVGIPGAVGLAILRHRLYDIDVVIKRTLVYGSLSVLLLAAYLLFVLTTRLVVSPLTNDSDLAVAASTLAVAALFRPLRSRVQAAVDRRFYRSRYDASRTLSTFASALRDEVDLETLGVDLRGVVRDTMQPAHVSLWLREAVR